MDANVVFQIVKALSKEEQGKLLQKLNEEIEPNFKANRHKTISENEAIIFLLKTVFHKSKHN